MYVLAIHKYRNTRIRTMDRQQTIRGDKTLTFSDIIRLEGRILQNVVFVLVAGNEIKGDDDQTRQQNQNKAGPSAEALGEAWPFRLPHHVVVVTPFSGSWEIRNDLAWSRREYRRASINFVIFRDRFTLVKGVSTVRCSSPDFLARHRCRSRRTHPSFRESPFSPSSASSSSRQGKMVIEQPPCFENADTWSTLLLMNLVLKPRVSHFQCFVAWRETLFIYRKSLFSVYFLSFSAGLV